MTLRGLLIACLFAASALGQTSGMERVLIRTSKPYTKVVANVQSQGGKVTYQYKYVNAIAAEIPQSKISGLLAAGGIASVSKDLIVESPSGVDVNRGRPMGAPASTNIVPDSVNPLSAQEIASLSAQPSAYIVNNSLMGLDSLFAAGKTGAGIVVALIDSGIRPGFPHISDSVIGGEDFVSDGLGFSNFANEGHGTFVAGMVAAHVNLLFASTSSLVQAVNRYAPGAVLPGPVIGGTPTSAIPMIGTAPSANIYALRVFGPTGGAPTSRILAAMERAVDLREMYNAGQTGGVNIRVCNMSLGGATIAAGSISKMKWWTQCSSMTS